MHALGEPDCREIDVLGVSWGGGLAQQYAYLYPDRCRRLILAATSAGSIMVPGRLSVLRRLANPRRYNDRSYLNGYAATLRWFVARRAEVDRPSHQQFTVTGRTWISLPIAGDLGLDQPAMAAPTASAHLDHGRNGRSDSTTSERKNSENARDSSIATRYFR